MISINKTSILNIFRGGGVLSVLFNLLKPRYSITYADNGLEAIQITSIVDVKINGNSVISTAPTEAISEQSKAGGYVSYNKVKQPTTIHVVFTVEGLTGFAGAIPNIFNLTMDSRSATIEQLQSMLKTATLYNIETPDKVYEGFDLVNFDFETRSNKGVTLLTVGAVFQEVNTTMEVELSKPEQKESSTPENDAKETETAVSATQNLPTSEFNTAEKNMRDVILDASIEDGVLF